MNELTALDATGQAELVRTKEVTPTELLDACIEQVEAVNPAVNAVITTMYDEARRTLEDPLPDGPFTGVPFLLKDGGSAASAGVRLTCGSGFLLDHVATVDGHLTARYKAAGLVSFGRTNLPEFGLQPTTEPEATGATLNPWDVTRSAGGSSGGAAAAVATRMAAMASGSDSGGSIRIPASCCGVFGLKPTRLRTSSGRRRMGISMRMGMLSEHALTRSVRDSAALLQATAGSIAGDPFVAPAPRRPYVEEVGADPGRLRIVLSTTAPGGEAPHPDCVAAVEEAGRLCEELGHYVDEGVPRLDLGNLASAFGDVASAGVAWDVRNWERVTGRVARAEDFEAGTWALVERGRSAGMTAEALMDALVAMQDLVDAMAAFTGLYDVWLTPTAAAPPPPLGTFTYRPDDPLALNIVTARYLAFATLINATGQPAMSVPLYWNEANLPIGVQFVGPYGDEGMLLRLAAQLEAARPWADRVPPAALPMSALTQGSAR